jgi:nucleoside-diphosphate-sugar epimerase
LGRNGLQERNLIGTVAVTGATGFIGRHLTASLIWRGVTVRAIIRPGSRSADPPGATIVRAPLEARALADAFAGVDAVVHLAGVVSAVDAKTYAAINAEGTGRRRRGRRRGRASCAHLRLAAAGPRTHRRRAARRCTGSADAMRTKQAGQRHALLAFPSLRWTVLRPGVVYGPGDRAVLPLFKLAAGLVAPVVGRPGAAYTFVYISDVVRAIEAALEGSSVGGTFFVGHPQPVTPRGLLETIQKTIGRRGALVTVPMPITRVAAEVCDVVGRMTGRAMLINRWRYAELAAEGFVCRVDRMRDVLGVAAAVDLASGIAKTAEWYRSVGWL